MVEFNADYWGRKSKTRKKAPFSGGFFSDIADVFKAGKEDVKGILSSLPRLPGAAVSEIGELLASLPGNPEHVRGAATADVRAEAKKRGLKGSQAKVFEAAARPGVRLLPISWVAQQVAGGSPEELLRHPVYTALDVLPVVSKAVRLGSRAVGVAESAASRAGEIGRVGRAVTMRERGLTIPQAGAEMARRFEERLPIGKRVSTVLEEKGVGGARTRRLLEVQGIRNRNFQQDVGKFYKEAADAAEGFEKAGIDAATQGRLLRELEFADDAWRTSLSPQHKAFIDWYERHNDRFFKIAERAGEAIELGGHRWFRRDSPQIFRLVDEAKRHFASGNQDKLSEVLVRLDKTLTRRPPATFYPMVRQQIANDLEQLLGRTQMTPEQFGAAMEKISAGKFRELPEVAPIRPKDITKIGYKARRLWREWADNGAVPGFVHHVPRSEVGRLKHPVFDPVNLLKTPAAYKARSLWDMEPWEASPVLSLTDQAVGVAQRVHADEFLDELATNGMVFDKAGVDAQLASTARKMAEGRPAGTYETVLSELRKEHFQGFNPANVFPFRLARGNQELFIPKGLASTLDRLAHPPKMLPDFPGKGVPMRLFRTSVLYASPPYYAGNLVTDALLVAARGNPLDLRYLFGRKRAARRMGVDYEGLKTEIGTGAQIGTTDMAQNVSLARAGWKLGQDLETGWIARGLNRVTGAEQFLARTAGSIDDMYRTIGYLAEYRRAMKKGANPEVAASMAFEHANKVLMSMDALTPLERAVAKGVLMPFYSWSKFLLSWTMSYPFDHPWRAAIVANLSKQITEEWDEGLPWYLMSKVPVGTDKEGRTKMMNLGFVFPWVSLANIDTKAGLLARLNPGIQAVFEAYGLDPFTGEASFFGERKFDPYSGRRVLEGPNLMELLLNEFVPQSEGVRMMLDLMPPDDREYYLEHPEKFVPDLAQRWGISIPRPYDVEDIRKRFAKAQKQQARAEAKQARKSEPAQVGGGVAFNPSYWGS